MAIGALGWAACLASLALLPGAEAAALFAAGLVMGLPVGVIMAMPAQALQPENRAVGIGLFYVWLYVGHAGVPPLAGWIGDRTGDAAAPLLIAAVLVAAMLPLFLAFMRARKPARPG
jgi:fucose permease